MKPSLVTAILLLAASPALAQSIPEKTGINSLVGASPTTADFVKEAAISDMFEIRSSELALEQGDEPTKAFARQMIADHQKTTSAIKEMVGSGKIPAAIPTALDGTHRGKVDTLKGMKGAEFKAQYASDQVTAHKNAVDLYQRYAKGGDNPELKAWAGRTEPALAHHLEMANALGK